MTGMDDNSEQIEVGTKVELRPEMAGVYKRASAGSVGIVADLKVDEGFPMVYIEWDKSHWRYNGEPDGWTFESHFKPTNQTNLLKALEDPKGFSERVIDRVGQTFDATQEDYARVLDGYLEQLNEVVNLLSESNGFIVLASRDEVHPEDPEKQIIVPYVYGGFLDQESMILLETQMMQMTGNAQMELAQQILRQLNQHKKSEEE